MNEFIKPKVHLTDAREPGTERTARWTNALPYLLLVIATLLWAGNFIAGRLLRDEVPPVALSFWRWALALVVLLPASAAQLRQHRRLILHEWKLITALGASGIATYSVFVYTALAVNPAINAALVLALIPLLIVLASWLIDDERIGDASALGLVVSLLGATVVVTRGKLETLHFATNDLWMLAAIPNWALYTVLQKRRPPDLPSLALLTASVVMGVLLLSPFYLWRYGLTTPITLTLTSGLGVGYIALGASAVAYLLWNCGVAVLGPVRSGPFLHLIPLFSAVFAVALLGESVAGYHIIGAVLIIGGIALGGRRSSGRRIHGGALHYKMNRIDDDVRIERWNGCAKVDTHI